MCSISGLVVLDGANPSPDDLAIEVANLLAIGASRGSDAAGIAAVSRSGALTTWHSWQLPEPEDILDVLGTAPSAVLAINRATPTTEWSTAQRLTDLQPFSAAGWVAVHNGTIANDRELATSLASRPPSLVDSAVLPGLMAGHGFLPALEQVAGSFAVAAVDLEHPGTIHLARNFKPLCVARHGVLPVVRFASVPEQLAALADDGRLDLDGPRLVQPPPFTWMTLRANGHHRSGGLRTTGPDGRVERAGTHRVLAVTSGGLDSTVAAAHAVSTGADVTLLHFAYGCHAQTAERHAVERVGLRLGCPVRIESLARLGELGGSSLTTEGAELAVAEEGAEFPHEWVPARNMLMLAYACAIADAEGFDEIMLGTNLEEGGAYPDNTQEFIDQMSRSAALGTLRRTTISAPLGALVKHEIVSLGHALGAPLDESWSCYRAERAHCGRCGPCFMRRVAFEMADLPDPTIYLESLERVRPVT